MTDREKLIDLLMKPLYPMFTKKPICSIADYLLDNGVVVREKGEWIEQTPEDKRYCWSPWKCKNCEMPAGKHKTSFCPNCGADMRGEK